MSTDIITDKPSTFSNSAKQCALADVSAASSISQSVNYCSPVYSPKKDAAMVEEEAPIKGSEDAIREAKEIQQTAQKMSSSGIRHSDHLVIFLHGYNNTQLAVDKRTAILDEKLGTSKVITTAFNWPSYHKLFSYTEDQEKVQECAGFFISYLNELRKGDIHKFNQIDIICHSMGNYLLTQTIQLCVEGGSIDLFAGCNIICVAADSPYDEYNKSINDVYAVISNWIHYWTYEDWAVWVSGYYNGVKRAGQSECKYKDDPNYSKVLSVEWTEIKFMNTDHGYIDEILGDNDKSADEVIKRLNIPFDTHDEEKEDESKSSEFEKYSSLWDKCYINDNSVSWMTDNFVLEKYADKKTSIAGKYGQFKLQRKKGGLWGVSGSDNFRIIYCRDLNENEWKEMDSSNNEDELNGKYNDFIEMINWKTEIMKLVEIVDELIEMLE